MKSFLGVAFAGGCAVLLAGCNAYTPPGRQADLRAIASADIRSGFAARPRASFPVAIAVVQVQAPGYENYRLLENGGSYGTGRYSLVTTHEVGDTEQLDQVRSLPGIHGLVSLNRMLLPTQLDDDQPLRQAAARLQADMLLLYTFDTKFIDADDARVLTAISLGILPTRRVSAVTTVSALLMDTRTGYIYAAFEETEKEETRTDVWASNDTADRERQANEKQAFGKLVSDFSSTWPGISRRYASN